MKGRDLLLLDDAVDNDIHAGAGAVVETDFPPDNRRWLSRVTRQ